MSYPFEFHLECGKYSERFKDHSPYKFCSICREEVPMVMKSQEMIELARSTQVKADLVLSYTQGEELLRAGGSEDALPLDEIEERIALHRKAQKAQRLEGELRERERRSRNGL